MDLEARHPTVEDVARVLDRAQRTATSVDQLPDGMSLADAYAAQHALLSLRAGRGERLIGTKLGLTSKAKMAQMGVSEVIVGQLTDAMSVCDDGTVRLDNLVHPRVEPEIAFRLSRDVDLDNRADSAVCAIDAVAPALEIIDSRYRDFRFDLSSVIADNTSAAAFVVGAWHPLDGDASALPDYEVELIVGGAVMARGATSDILDHPANALRQLTTIARRYGFPLTAGQVILAGAATAALPFTRTRVEARVHGLGSASAHGI